MPTLILVVPCFNEAQRLDIEAFRRASAADRSVEYLFVNDGSVDGTLDTLRGLESSANGAVRVLNLPKNGGKAEAVRQGMRAAVERAPRFVGFWDADLSTPLDAVPEFLEVLAARPGVHMVFGARVALLGRSIRRHPWRHYLGRLFATAVSTILRLPIYDTQCGAKIFRVRPELSRVLATPFVSSWLFDVEILIRAIDAEPGGRAALKDAVYELPLREWRDVPGSKLRGMTYVRAAATLARVIRSYWRELRRP